MGISRAEILLPEGRTVEQIVREAAAKALAEKGYAVVAEESPEFANALPVNIEIQQFWSWFTPGAFLISVEFVGTVLLKGEVLAGSNEETVRATAPSMLWWQPTVNGRR